MTYAETHGHAEYDGRSHKYLSENRDLYQLMSRMTTQGRVPTMEEVRREFNRGPGADAA